MPDLTPMNRTEALLAGEDLEPMNREEWFLKQAGSGGSSVVPTPEAADSGKVLTAGADGTASWQTAGGGGEFSLVAHFDEVNQVQYIAKSDIDYILENAPTIVLFTLEGGAQLDWPIIRDVVVNETEYKFVRYTGFAFTSYNSVGAVLPALYYAPGNDTSVFISTDYDEDTSGEHYHYYPLITEYEWNDTRNRFEEVSNP